ncbi:hypothetical protein B0J11DRAFT_501664 [Dendryphion nanum]|uniref:polynucleotide adenylyltransferase n=1 Tax=Dendryphion nanum TaxID=256645 RepID=A0A9P9IZE7_9PLEO|nr:hypothetical protein B0J11DRAFT_501664 [Dendryphion nanum]
MDQAPLEDRLRSMILGNVTISEQPTAAPNSERGRGHQRRPYRGRGRGGFHQAQHATNQGQAAAAPSTRGDRHDRGRYRNPNVNTQGHIQSQGNLDPSSGSHARQARSPSHQNFTAHMSTPQAPRILQRPPSESNSPYSPSAPQTSPRNFRPTPYGRNPMPAGFENPLLQSAHLDSLATEYGPQIEISRAEVDEKEAFRRELEIICKNAIVGKCPDDLVTISLVGFGSLASGFGMPGSDMDLAIVPEYKNPHDRQRVDIDEKIPRILEEAILEKKMGGRLLTRTRVPILKVCQKPTEELYAALYDERRKWNELPDEEQYAQPPAETPNATVDKSQQVARADKDGTVDSKSNSKPTKNLSIDVVATKRSRSRGPQSNNSQLQDSAGSSLQPTPTTGEHKDEPQKERRAWHREKVLGPLDFPKDGVGIQCDINFSNPLGIHNTHLLRCYSLCDPRVRPMVLFVKAWAKRRKINSSYSGTLSSYGWVLMVLHYLVNIASPPVLPNLQLCWPAPSDLHGLERVYKETLVAGYAVRFWRDEEAIIRDAKLGKLTRNTQSLGSLLRGFFYYFASMPHVFGSGPRQYTFHWTKEVLALRTLGGLRTKADKGWTAATTTIAAGKEVRQRYLFAIEDPFEVDHNVARTVTHNGIVAIRDEFRRVWRILSAVGSGAVPEGGLFDEVVEEARSPSKIDEAEKPKDGSADSGILHGAQEASTA